MRRVKLVWIMVALLVLFVGFPCQAEGDTEEIVFEILGGTQISPTGNFARQSGSQYEVSSDGEYTLVLDVVANGPLPPDRGLWWVDLGGAFSISTGNCGIGEWAGAFEVMAGQAGQGRRIGLLSLVVDPSRGTCQADCWHYEISSRPTDYLARRMKIWLEVRPYPYGYAKVWIETPRRFRFIYMRELTPTPTATPTHTPTPTATLKPTWTPRPTKTVSAPTLVPWRQVYIPLLWK